ncbi:hypothetical protein RND81_10G198100 [Saponaria officinalis]|uniref:Replication factor A C-terminal domain-containing protein n=1 Tax=Saponaria officinalis TaxID=3572 RepID=A0AAW1I4G0_SAPOF
MSTGDIYHVQHVKMDLMSKEDVPVQKQYRLPNAKVKHLQNINMAQTYNLTEKYARYRIMAIISDGIAAVNIVLFNKEAEKVIGKPIEKLIDISEKEEGKEHVYEILRQCEGKQYTFKVKVAESKYNNER